MDSLGDILYIIVMVVALVFSIYKKTKGSHQDGTLLPEREVGDPFDEVFPTGKRRWLDEETVEKPVKHPPKPLQKEKTEGLGYQKIAFQRIQKSDALKRPERTTRITPRLTQKKSAVQKVESDQLFYWDEEPLDLQNAVIYAEIIKRPDY